MFIQVIQGTCTRPDELRAAAKQWRDELSEGAVGWLGGTYGFTDDDRFLGVVRFDSSSACLESAAAPEVFVAGNAHGVALDESHMAHAVVHVAADGKLQQACIEDQPNEKSALAKFENAPEVDRHEK